jgi:hypothetical protein
MKIFTFSDKKGMALLGAVLLVVLCIIGTMALNSLLQRYVHLNELQETSFRDFYYAELGIYRAKWLLDRGFIDYSVPNPNPYIAPPFAIPGVATHQLTISVLENAVNDHDITSDLVEISSGTILRTVQAQYIDSTITLLD